jgi:hypothetical protein
LGIDTNKHDSLTSEADIVVMPTATEGPTRLGLRMRRGLPLLKSLDLDKEETRDPNTFSGSSVFCKNMKNSVFRGPLKTYKHTFLTSPNFIHLFKFMLPSAVTL